MTERSNSTAFRIITAYLFGSSPNTTLGATIGLQRTVSHDLGLPGSIFLTQDFPFDILRYNGE
ncbi:MAG TPA: hypothetical protein VIT91_08635 [Chthoniobacterales bacterium]